MIYANKTGDLKRTAPARKILPLTAFAPVAGEPAEELLRRALAQFGQDVALASSFSMEDNILTDMLFKIDKQARIFALDTGRLNEETYECAERVRRRYGFEIEWFFPDKEAVEAMVGEKGLFSFKESIDNRKECCFIRKVEPLNRALSGLQAWITGQRREQSTTRATLELVEQDDAHGGIAKLNPLAFWSAEQVRRYVDDNAVPYNRLYDQGYASIGCAPCTRPLKAGEDERAGRWWWESAEHKECGIHLVSSGAEDR